MTLMVQGKQLETRICLAVEDTALKLTPGGDQLPA